MRGSVRIKKALAVAILAITAFSVLVIVVACWAEILGLVGFLAAIIAPFWAYDVLRSGD